MPKPISGATNQPKSAQMGEDIRQMATHQYAKAAKHKTIARTVARASRRKKLITVIPIARDSIATKYSEDELSGEATKGRIANVVKTL